MWNVYFFLTTVTKQPLESCKICSRTHFQFFSKFVRFYYVNLSLQAVMRGAQVLCYMP